MENNMNQKKQSQKIATEKHKMELKAHNRGLEGNMKLSAKDFLEICRPSLWPAISIHLLQKISLLKNNLSKSLYQGPYCASPRL